MNPTTVRTPTLAYHHILALLLILFSMGMSAFISQFTFERLPHLEDEVAYLWEAKLLARGQTVIDSPAPRRAYWQPFVVDFGENRFGKYTLGWPLILSIGVFLGQAWIVNTLLSGLTVALVYRLGLEIFNPDVGVFAAALTAFSPMALLLNASLMGHTAALFTTMLFMYAYWRMEQGRYALRWGVLAGIALGFSVVNRPLAGLALAAPFVVWSGMRLLQTLIYPNVAQSPVTDSVAELVDSEVPRPKGEGFRVRFTALKSTLFPLLALAAVTSIILGIIPAFNYAATGDASKNLYTLVWSYDQVGFGEGYGRNIHTLEKGLRQTRWDLSLTAADLFGWQAQPLLGTNNEVKPELRQHLLFDGDYWQPVGLSWLLLPFGLLIGIRRRSWLLAIWLILGGIIFAQSTTLPPAQLQDPRFAYLWMIGAAVYLCVPIAVLLLWKPRDPQTEWTYLLLAFSLFLLLLHVAYWIGSQRYSTRYYFEMLAPLAIISALPLAWIARRWKRWPVYTLVTIALVYFLFSYGLPRVHVLYRFNWVSPELIDAVQTRREANEPVLVLIKGADVRWRALGSLMAVTSPLLDSDIVAAIDNTSPGFRDQILDRFPNRQIIEMTAAGNYICFGDSLEGECYGEIPTPPATG
jgi:hypothetical protein